MHKLNIEKDIFAEKNMFGDEINHSFDIIEENGSGAIVIINNNIAPNILKAFDQRQKQNNKLELREYGVGAQILKDIGIEKIILLTNSNKKIIALNGFGIEIIKQQKI